MVINLLITIDTNSIIILLIIITGLLYKINNIFVIKKICKIHKRLSKKHKHKVFDELVFINTTYINIKNLFNITFPEGMKKEFYLNSIGIRGKSYGKFITHNISCNIQFQSNYTSIILSKNSKNIMTIPNAGGNSCTSEIISYEIIQELIEMCYPKKKKNKFESIVTENEIKYIFQFNSPKTDYIIEYGNKYIAVSVTRAMHYDNTEFNSEKALKLIEGKIRRINESNENVLAPNNWNKQILHIITQKIEYAKILEEVFDNLDKKNTERILIVCSVFNGKIPFLKDEFIRAGIIDDNAIIQVSTEYLC